MMLMVVITRLFKTPFLFPYPFFFRSVILTATKVICNSSWFLFEKSQKMPVLNQNLRFVVFFGIIFFALSLPHPSSSPFPSQLSRNTANRGKSALPSCSTFGSAPYDALSFSSSWTSFSNQSFSKKNLKGLYTQNQTIPLSLLTHSPSTPPSPSPLSPPSFQVLF